MTKPHHVLLTRFNLPSTGHESVVRARENWLRDRVGLFERFCLPSVLWQSERRFSWLVYFDRLSPAWLREWADEHEAAGHFRAVFREEVPRAELVSDIRAVVGEPRGARLLTTNLDNDDSLAPDFVARLQAVGTPAPRAAVYIADGLIIHEQALYRRVDLHNAFCSVLEDWSDPVTCWVDWHNLLPEHMPAVVLRGEPGWLQVVHGANVSNRVRGRRARPARHREAFGALLDQVPEPSGGALARDALLAVPWRAARDGARAGAKAAVRATLGKEGLDRATAAWARVTRVRQ